MARAIQSPFGKNPIAILLQKWFSKYVHIRERSWNKNHNSWSQSENDDRKIAHSTVFSCLVLPYYCLLNIEYIYHCPLLGMYIYICSVNKREAPRWIAREKTYARRPDGGWGSVVRPASPRCRSDWPMRWVYFSISYKFTHGHYNNVQLYICCGVFKRTYAMR